MKGLCITAVTRSALASVQAHTTLWDVLLCSHCPHFGKGQMYRYEFHWVLRLLLEIVDNWLFFHLIFAVVCFLFANRFDIHLVEKLNISIVRIPTILPLINGDQVFSLLGFQAAQHATPRRLQDHVKGTYIFGWWNSWQHWFWSISYVLKIKVQSSLFPSHRCPLVLGGMLQRHQSFSSRK